MWGQFACLSGALGRAGHFYRGWSFPRVLTLGSHPQHLRAGTASPREAGPGREMAEPFFHLPLELGRFPRAPATPLPFPLHPLHLGQPESFKGQVPCPYFCSVGLRDQEITRPHIWG